MNRVRIIVVVPEMTDEEALMLKKQLEELVKDKEGSTVEVSMSPARPIRW